MKLLFPTPDSKPIAGRRQLFFLIVFFLCSVSLGLYSTHCGLLTTSDSLQYLSAAASFRTDLTFLSPDGSFYAYWPPLLPIVLSFFGAPLVALEWIHVLSLLTFAIISLKLAQFFFETHLFQNLFLLLVLVNVHVIMIFSFAWSELLFMAIAFLNFYLVLNSKRSGGFFWGALITGFFLCLQRNAGLFWMMGSCVWIFFTSEENFRPRIIKTLILFVGSTLGLWAWNIHRTYFLPADFAFYQLSFFDGFWQNIYLAGISIGGIFAPVSYLPMAGYLFIVGITVSIFFSFKRRHPQFTLVSCILVFYIGCFVCLGPLDKFEMDRYFSVVVPLIIAFFLWQIENNLRRLGTVWRVGVIVAVVGWCLYPFVRTLNNAERWHERSCSQRIPE